MTFPLLKEGYYCTLPPRAVRRKHEGCRGLVRLGSLSMKISDARFQSPIYLCTLIDIHSPHDTTKEPVRRRKSKTRKTQTRG
ncbi:hypothetical protein E2C01_096077 [Portunus trituberculatus]|uniref:Uncharacterized protein n=1 Tax=Portunus trituberculatus TaxID=210409 RepID=A0A5B7K7B9_PORTR|nr:hypothetical protein [Portunus trituberculatus]